MAMGETKQHVEELLKKDMDTQMALGRMHFVKENKGQMPCIIKLNQLSHVKLIRTERVTGGHDMIEKYYSRLSL